MSSIGETFRQFLLADTTGVRSLTAGRIHQNVVPQVSNEAMVWFQRTAEEELTGFDGGTGLRAAVFDLECIGATADSAIDLADAVKTRVHGAKSSTGDRYISGMLVESHDDDYEPKNTGEDAGRHIASLGVQIWYSTPTAGWTAAPDVTIEYSHTTVSVNSSASSVALAGTNDRRYALFQNDGANKIWLTCATSTGAATANSGIPLQPYGGSYDFSPTGSNLTSQTIHAIAESSTGNNLLVVTNAT